MIWMSRLVKAPNVISVAYWGRMVALQVTTANCAPKFASDLCVPGSMVLIKPCSVVTALAEPQQWHDDLRLQQCTVSVLPS